MSMLFQQGATGLQKVATIIVLLIALLMLVGVFGHVLIRDEVFRGLAQVSAVLGVLVVIWWVIVLRNPQSAVSQRLEQQGQKRWKVMLAGVFAFPIFMVIAGAKGVPTVGHWLLAQPAQLTVTVAHKNSSYHQKYCTGGFEIAGEHAVFNQDICGLAEDDWSALHEHDQVLLMGSQSWFGFDYQQYARL